MDLGSMLVSVNEARFQRYGDLLITDEVGLVVAAKLPSSVGEIDLGLADKWDVFFLKFDSQTLLVDGFQKPTVLRFIHFKASTSNSIKFLFEK